VAIMEVKLELGPGLGLLLLLVRFLGLGGYELDYESSLLLILFCLFVIFIIFFLLTITLEKS